MTPGNGCSFDSISRNLCSALSVFKIQLKVLNKEFFPDPQPLFLGARRSMQALKETLKRCNYSGLVAEHDLGQTWLVERKAIHDGAATFEKGRRTAAEA